MYRVVVKSRGKDNNVTLGKDIVARSVLSLALQLPLNRVSVSMKQKSSLAFMEISLVGATQLMKRFGKKLKKLLTMRQKNDIIDIESEGTKMPKWSVDVYFSACQTVEVEADSYLEAREKGLAMVEEPDEDDFSVEEIECYRVWEGEDEDAEV